MIFTLLCLGTQNECRGVGIVTTDAEISPNMVNYS